MAGRCGALLVRPAVRLRYFLALFADPGRLRWHDGASEPGRCLGTQHPRNGTIWNDPDDPSKGYWADHTYAHGAPLFAGEVKDIVIEMPRAGGQLFYQFDDLFHDNAIFSPHPITDSGLTGNQ